ncbi:unnamed protein product [Nesidiocoris tenuis]|uniref:Uncharacterized protein n=1 Tax=Nesidiocoris tenuis TaxID=355587 RepID=A0A6H5H8L6_9HEMI|nr:unnamed protein product [Nesidiocoris tenuis]
MLRDLHRHPCLRWQKIPATGRQSYIGVNSCQHKSTQLHRIRASQPADTSRRRCTKSGRHLVLTPHDAVAPSQGVSSRRTQLQQLTPPAPRPGSSPGGRDIRGAKPKVGDHYCTVKWAAIRTDDAERELYSCSWMNWVDSHLRYERSDSNTKAPEGGVRLEGAIPSRLQFTNFARKLKQLTVKEVATNDFSGTRTSESHATCHCGRT